MNCTFSRTVTALLGILLVTGCSTIESQREKTETIGTSTSEARSSRAKLRFDQAKTKDTIEGYEEFLQEYPKGELADQVRARIRELYEERDWKKASQGDTIQSYKNFVKKYPNSKFLEDAIRKVDAEEVSSMAVDFLIADMLSRNMGRPLKYREWMFEGLHKAGSSKEKLIEEILKGEKRLELALVGFSPVVSYDETGAAKLDWLSYRRGSIILMESGRLLIYDSVRWWEIP